MDDGYVLVIGSSGVDVKGRPDTEAVAGRSNLGRVHNNVGGVARNIAENLARLEVPTILMTVVGHDLDGKRVLRSCERAGVNCDYVKHIPRGRTGSYVAMLHPNGQLHYAVSDFGIIEHLDSDYVLEHDYLIQAAQMVVIDATLDEDVLETILELADLYNVRVVADPTAPELAHRLKPYIPQLYMIVPNGAEINDLCGTCHPTIGREDAQQAARDLVARGAEIAVVTLGAAGLAYADGSGSGYLRAINSRVVDTTGAGDAFTGAAIFGLASLGATSFTGAGAQSGNISITSLAAIGGVTVANLQLTAASLTLESPYTVLPNLNQKILYDQLMA